MVLSTVIQITETAIHFTAEQLRDAPIDDLCLSATVPHMNMGEGAVFHTSGPKAVAMDSGAAKPLCNNINYMRDVVMFAPDNCRQVLAAACAQLESAASVLPNLHPAVF